MCQGLVASCFGMAMRMVCGRNYEPALRKVCTKVTIELEAPPLRGILTGAVQSSLLDLIEAANSMSENSDQIDASRNITRDIPRTPLQSQRIASFLLEELNRASFNRECFWLPQTALGAPLSKFLVTDELTIS